MSDIEKNEKGGIYVVEDDGAPAVHNDDFGVGDTYYARLQRFAGSMKIEQRGIERVPEDERTDKHLFKIGTMWLSTNMVVSGFAVGALAGTVFQLGFVNAFLTVLFFNIVSVLPVCLFSTLGPAFGLRQMVLSRFYFGGYTIKLAAFFSALSCLGWSGVNVIVGAQLINTVNPHVPGFAGIIIIAICTLLVTLFGYKVVHKYEMYSWIPCFIVFLVVLGEFAHSGSFRNLPMGVGTSEAGSVLSFGAAIYGFATGWTTLAADYSCYQPANSSKAKVFGWTFVGLVVPMIFTMSLGVALSTAVDLKDATNPYTIGWKTSGNGGIIGVALDVGSGSARGHFGSFCLVILALGIIANNCPNIYSLTFSLQLLTHKAAMVPRFVWTFVGTGIYIAVAIPGYDHFATYLEDFMLFLGYWLAIYQGISLTDHFVFRRASTSNYDISTWDSTSKLPPGIAALVAFACGVAGAILGINQPEWFVGPIAKRIGQFGGDVGFELALGFTAVVYLALRPIEKSIFRR